MRIAVYGAGALGTILGAYLTKNDLNDEIHLFNRNVLKDSYIRLRYQVVG